MPSTSSSTTAATSSPFPATDVVSGHRPRPLDQGDARRARGRRRRRSRSRPSSASRGSARRSPTKTPPRPTEAHSDVGGTVVSRTVQSTVGLLTGAAVAGIALGGLFALVYAFALGRVTIHRQRRHDHDVVDRQGPGGCRRRRRGAERGGDGRRPRRRDLRGCRRPAGGRRRRPGHARHPLPHHVDDEDGGHGRRPAADGAGQPRPRRPDRGVLPGVRRRPGAGRASTATRRGCGRRPARPPSSSC